MGKAVKTIVGIGLIAVGGGFIAGAWGATTAFTIAGFAVTNAMISSMVGLSLLGQALAPDMPESGAYTSHISGVKLQTHKSNTMPVPILYGRHLVGGNIVYETTNDAIHPDSNSGKNKDYWGIIAIAGHEINRIVRLVAGEDNMQLQGNVYYRPKPQHFTQAIFYNAVSGNYNTLYMQFPTYYSGNTFLKDSGVNLDLPDIDLPSNVAYIAQHQKFDGIEGSAPPNTQLLQILAEVEGKKIRTITNQNTISTDLTYSTNPVEILLDLMGIGLDIPDEDIDIPSFYTAKVFCDNINWSCNIAFMEQTIIATAMQAVLATFRGSIIHSNNTWKITLDEKNAIVDKVITADDTVNNNISIAMANTKDISNKIIVKYINPDDEWLSAEVSAEDTELQSIDGRVLEKILQIPNVTNKAQAQKLAEITLNSMRYTEDEAGNRIKQTPLVVQFATTAKHCDLEVSDIITIEHSLLDRPRKFVLVSVDTDHSGLIQISAREHAETHYKDVDGNYLI